MLLLLLAGLVLGTGGPALAQSEQSDVAEMEAALSAVPVFYNFESPRLREIAAAGDALGNRRTVFTTVGDSNTSSGDFLRPLGLEPNQCALGPYAGLQRALEFFATPPREGYRNSFTNDSLAAEIGFSSAAVLDPFWASQSACEGNETPLQCELRLVRPSAAIIMLGQIDINYGNLSVEDYRANMTRIIETSIARGVIPVLTTIVFLPDRDVYPKSLQYNLTLVELAQQYEIPLINLWLAVQPLPDSGIGPDRSHLKARVGSFCSFNGPQQELGATLRNLLTLQALDQLRQEVLAG